jgi:predicted patatin/cPLA2 family phospholipase
MTTVKSFQELCKILKEREKSSGQIKENIKQNKERKKQFKKRIKHG